MTTTAIIGGTGVTRLEGLRIDHCAEVDTPFGPPSSPIIRGDYYGHDILFLARHGSPHHIPPHRINYRANIWSLREAGASRIIAIAAVGGIRQDMQPGCLAVPDQIIDYTYGREHSFFQEDQVVHVDFTVPYTAAIREALLAGARANGIDVIDGGVYGATQGPRLETAAEIARMEHDGCALVGMTGMPEAALARELGLDYACLALIANWAAGKSETEITMAEIEFHLADAMARAQRVLDVVLRQ